jgi:hypothetical protein
MFEYGEPTKCEKCGGPRRTRTVPGCVYTLHGEWRCEEERDVDAERDARNEA